MTTISEYARGYGDRMRYLRRTAELKQDGLAEKLDVTRQSISGYETERLFPSIKVVDKMCNLYGINPWWLLYGVGDPSSSTEGIIPRGGLPPPSHGREELTHAQLTIIEYVKANKEAALNLANFLWNKALKLSRGEEDEE